MTAVSVQAVQRDWFPMRIRIVQAFASVTPMRIVQESVMVLHF